MRLVKKVTAAAMASAMALSLAACGGGSTATTAAPTEAAKETAAASEAATEAAKEAAETAAQAGVKVYGMSDFVIGQNKDLFPSTVILGYASLKESEITEGCKRLVNAWKELEGE